MTMTVQKKIQLRAKVALALRDTLDRQPTDKEIDRYLVAAQVLWKVVAGTKAMRRQMKNRRQLAIF
jgi:hypothetical protein